ncbi:unnamed protein product [Rhizophagus irregularis]|nr:unnamed protein product [Rhizophagus irregularis]
MLEILNGRREIPTSDAPIDYVNTYKRCWQDNPNDRPDMQQVLSELKSINLNMKNDLSYVNNINENIQNDTINDIDENNEIIINELILLYEDFIQKEIYYEDDYIQLIIKKYIIFNNKNINEIFNYLLNNNKKNKQNIILLAIFYRYGIGIEKNEMKAFELYEEMTRKAFVKSEISEKSNSKKIFEVCVKENNKINAQKYINQKYPTKEEKEKENRLIINNKDLEGHLDLSEFVNLEILNCSNNQLISLDIRKNMRLTDLDCSQNKLTNLDLTSSSNITYIRANYNQLIDIRLPIVNNNEKLEYINLFDNSLSQNLDCFGCFFNLKQLFIVNTDEYRIQQGIFNRFHGSLKPLKSLNKLESLNINNTDIDSGIEYLPDSVKNFRCSIDKRPEAKVKIIYKQLEIFAIDVIDTLKGRYNLRAWKENWKLSKEYQKSALNGKEYEEKGVKSEFFTAEQLMENGVSHEEANSLKGELLIKESKEKYKKQLGKELGNPDELRTKEDEYANLEDQLIKSKSLISSIESRKKELKYLKKKLDEQKYETRSSTASLRRQMNDLEKDINSSWKQLIKTMKIDNKFEEIKVNEEDQQKERSHLQDCLEKLHEDKENLCNKLEIYNNQLTDKEDFINKLQQQTRKNIEELKKQLNEETRKYENSQEKLAILDNQSKVKDDLIQQSEQHIDELKRQLKEINALYPQIETKEIELRNTINTISIKSELGKKGKRLLDNLLEEQIKIVLTNDNFSSEKLEKVKLKLSEEEELTNEEIQNILNKQTEVTWLKLKLKSLQD